MILLLGLVATAALAAPDADTLRARWAEHAALITALSPVPVGLRESDFAPLARGRAVTHRVNTSDATYATGAIWVAAPVQAPWIVLSDAPHAPPPPPPPSACPSNAPPGTARSTCTWTCPGPSPTGSGSRI